MIEKLSRTPLVSWLFLAWLLLLAAVVSPVQAQEFVTSTTYFHTNLQGTPIAASDESGASKWTETYASYGLPAGGGQSVEPNYLRIGIAGHVEDQFADRALVYMQARYYDPALARFLSIDPEGFDAGNPQSFNRYAYANSNPGKYVDPDGELPFLVVAYYAATAAYTAYDTYQTYKAHGAGAAALTLAVDGAVSAGLGIAGKVAASAFRARKLDGIADGAGTGFSVPKSGGKLDGVAGTAAEPKRIYSARELKRRADEPGPNHNFPETLNESIFKGDRTVISDNYVQYSQRGSLNGRTGTYEIGVKPSASGRTEVITHRFFRPDPKQ